MAHVSLIGHLICKDADQARIVEKFLPDHIALTRAEPGCLFFAVEPTADPFIWSVEEKFSDESAFSAHQDRVAGSEWGRATSGIKRSYTISGIASP